MEIILLLNSNSYGSLYQTRGQINIESVNLSRSISDDETVFEKGIVSISGSSIHRIDIEDCIFDKNYQNRLGKYFSTEYEASIYIFRTTSDAKTKYEGGGPIDMSMMDTDQFENNFYIHLYFRFLIYFTKH